MDKKLSEFLSSKINDKDDDTLIREYKFLKDVRVDEVDSFAKFIRYSLVPSFIASSFVLFLFLIYSSIIPEFLLDSNRLQLVTIISIFVLFFILFTNLYSFVFSNKNNGSYNNQNFNVIQENIEHYGLLKPNIGNSFSYTSFDYIVIVIFLNNYLLNNSLLRNILFMGFSKEDDIYYKSSIDFLLRCYIQELEERELIGGIDSTT